MIWIGCLVGASVIMTIFQHAIGAPLGPLAKTLLVGGAIALAVALCKKVPPKNEDTNGEGEECDDTTYNDDCCDE
ncbi:MAG: hypothetical protein IJD33_01300 [Clostridia bacterium]|nr:hypothetical protein [Clostridia bacterium]